VAQKIFKNPLKIYLLTIVKQINSLFLFQKSVDGHLFLKEKKMTENKKKRREIKLLL